MPKRFKQLPKITRSEVAPQIRQTIGDGNTAEAVRLTEILSPELKTKILQHLHELKTEEALALCVGLGDQYLLLQGELNAAKNLSNTDLLSSEYFEATKSKINHTLQEWMAQKKNRTAIFIGWVVRQNPEAFFVRSLSRLGSRLYCRTDDSSFVFGTVNN